MDSFQFALGRNDCQFNEALKQNMDIIKHILPIAVVDWTPETYNDTLALKIDVSQTDYLVNCELAKTEGIFGKNKFETHIIQLMNNTLKRYL